MSEKQKRQHSLPNRQLARAFNFSASDLSANRAGYMTWAQAWGIPIWQREIFGWLDIILRWFRPKRQERITHICGKIELKFEMKEYHSARQVMVQDVYQLTMPESGIVLALNQKQYQIISDGAIYHLYVHLETGHILSLDRAINGCHE